jgi:two-component system, OmpR family, sensor kinase
MRSVTRRMVGTGLALLGLIGVVFLSIQMLSIHYLIGEVNRELHHSTAQELVEHMVVVWREQGGPPDLRAQLADLMRVNPAVDFYLLAPDGRILSAGNPAESVRLDAVAIAPIERSVADPRADVLGDDPREPGTERPFSAAPIRVDGVLRGYLYVVLESGRYARVIEMVRKRYALLLGVVIGLALLGVGAIAAVLRYAAVVRRLRTLGARMDAFRRAQDEPLAAAALGPRDELRRLEALFAELQQRVARQVAALERTDALRRELVAFVSHDLKKSLAAVSALVETLRTPPAPLSAAQQAQYLAAAERRLAGLSGLVEGLLALARLEDPDVAPRCEAFAATDLARDVVQLYQEPARRAGVALDVAAGADVPQAWGEVGLVERVLANLLENALQHTPAGGRVDVRVERQRGDVSISVRDTGAGIAPEDRPRLFEPFYRGHGEAADDARAGLGLAIARRIVELHGRELHVESTPRQGSTFRFQLPAPP